MAWLGPSVSIGTKKESRLAEKQKMSAFGKTSHCLLCNCGRAGECGRIYAKKLLGLVWPSGSSANRSGRIASTPPWTDRQRIGACQRR
jgi:hypothetical protein